MLTTREKRWISSAAGRTRPLAPILRVLLMKLTSTDSFFPLSSCVYRVIGDSRFAIMPLVLSSTRYATAPFLHYIYVTFGQVQPHMHCFSELMVKMNMVMFRTADTGLTVADCFECVLSACCARIGLAFAAFPRML